MYASVLPSVLEKSWASLCEVTQQEECVRMLKKFFLKMRAQETELLFFAK